MKRKGFLNNYNFISVYGDESTLSNNNNCASGCSGCNNTTQTVVSPPTIGGDVLSVGQALVGPGTEILIAVIADTIGN